MNSVGMPGPGGSLGQCAICGHTFLAEILLGKIVPSFKISASNQTLFAHQMCLPKDGEFDILTLPETSPLRRAFEEAKSKH